MLLKRVDRNTGAFEHRPGEHKAIYMAPLKALVQEKKEEWISRFGPLGIVCKELTGDADVASWSELTNVDIILTTPEKFDSITRKNKDRGGMAFFGDVALVMIDEVHILGDERGRSRGGHLAPQSTQRACLHAHCTSRFRSLRRVFGDGVQSGRRGAMASRALARRLSSFRRGVSTGDT